MPVGHQPAPCRVHSVGLQRGGCGVNDCAQLFDGFFVEASSCERDFTLSRREDGAVCYLGQNAVKSCSEVGEKGRSGDPADPGVCQEEAHGVGRVVRGATWHRTGLQIADLGLQVGDQRASGGPANCFSRVIGA